MQAQMMFDNGMYLQLLEIVNFAMRHPKGTSDNLEAEFVCGFIDIHLLDLCLFDSYSF